MTTPPDPHRDLRWAWGFVVLIVAGAILAQLVGYGLAALLGYDTDSGEPPPLGTALLIGLPAMAVAIAPALAALFYGVRAGRGGRWAGWAAAAIGALSVVYWVTLTLIGLIFEAAIT